MNNMSQYGYNFDESFVPGHDKIYNLLVELYGNPEFTKTKDTDTLSIYMTKTSCLLINECRYLIAGVPKDNNQVGKKLNLNQLEWTNFQTRLLKGRYDCSVCVNQPKSIHLPLELHTRTDKYTEYVNNEYLIKVSLLHNKTNNLYEHPNSGDLVAALEMYQTIISF